MSLFNSRTFRKRQNLIDLQMIRAVVKETIKCPVTSREVLQASVLYIERGLFIRYVHAFL